MTNKTQTQRYTPGPWTAEHSGTGDARVIGRKVLDCPFPFDPVVVARTSWENAWLIAAAPDLLAAAQSINASLDWAKAAHKVTYAGHEDIKAAIAKAEGREVK